MTTHQRIDSICQVVITVCFVIVTGLLFITVEHSFTNYGQSFWKTLFY